MPILGVWMWPQSVEAYGANRIAEFCVLSGITDIYFLTKGLAGSVSFHSAFAPQNGGRDLLSELLKSAHTHNIRVHAWLTSASDEHYKQLHPESGRVHFTRGADKGFISLADAGYLDYMEQIVRELCRHYEIDGLHLDYIRYNHLLYGWSAADQARYAAAGADISHLRRLMDETFLRGQDSDGACIFDALRAGDESVRALADVRRSDVKRFAGRLTSLARAEKNDLLLTAALMPEGAYEDTAFSDLHYGQNYEDAAALYDYVLPMAYSSAYQKDASWVRTVAEGSVHRGLKTVMGLHAYDGGTGSSLQADIRALCDTPVDGICLFRFGAFALAIPDGESLRLINTLDHKITSVTTEDGTPLLQPEIIIAPGGEATIPFPPAGCGLRVFCGSAEACVYCAKQR